MASHGLWPPHFYVLWLITEHVLSAVAIYLIMVWIDAGFNNEDITYGMWAKISQDICGLGLGTTGGIFAIKEVSHILAPIAGQIVLAIFIIDMACFVALATIRQKRARRALAGHSVDVPIGMAVRDVLLGFFTVGLACGLIYVGLTWK